MPSDKLICELCKKRYTRCNKQRHMKSKYCTQVQLMLENMRRVLKQPLEPEHPIKDKVQHPYYDSKGNLYYLTLRQVHFYKTLGHERYNFEPA